MPEIYIFYCASCQLAETVKQERAAQKPSQIVETADAAGSLVLIGPWLLHRKASLGISRIVLIQTDLQPSPHGSLTFRSERVSGFALAQPLQ